MRKVIALWMLLTAALAPAATPVIDPATGHRVVRISTAPGMASLYFHQNPFTPQGDVMVISTADGIAAVALKDWSIRPIVTGRGLDLLFVGRRTRTVYYSTRASGGGAAGGPNGETGALTVHAANIDTGRQRTVATIAAGSIGSINADETLLVGQVAARAMALQPGAGSTARFGQTEYAANGPDGKPLSFADAKEVRLNDRLEARIPMEIFTIDIRTGARKVVHRATDWLNHLQFSPTDPGLLMFCHEGPWHKVDRIWTIRTDGSALTKVHSRTMNMEIAGHEYWSPDGRTIWYDLQTPRGQVFWLAGYDIATARRIWYPVDRNQWSVHYTQSPDGRLFAGDGGDPEMVAHAPDGKWIHAFTPRSIPDVAGLHAADSATLIAPGLLSAEKLVDMRRHDYRLEPNIHFTPDGKWLVFRSNKDGDAQIYAVEVARATVARP